MTDVLNPSPVPLRLNTAALGAYTKLAGLLREIGEQANDAGLADHITADERTEWFAVRDAVRAAATEALVPRGGTRAPRCRRCGIDCPECTPPAAPDVPAESPFVNVHVAIDGYSGASMFVRSGDTYRLTLMSKDPAALAARNAPAELHSLITVVVG